ncbi:excalibur calcium-binding domain-containing protein [Streptomyces sp. NPDC048737]|uniref:excalibur calcium-binding domain-containing protein n=1 Tax=unclassified Streptomyces TaxID=2593676 RepID=UPI003420613D
MAGSARRGGPLWRARRRWARTGLFGRAATVVLGLLAAFIVLGGVLGACGAGNDEPTKPAPASSTETSTPSASDVPERPGPATEPPPPTATVTQSETVTEQAPPPTATVTEEVTTQPPANTAGADVYYDNCDEARDAGAAPVHAGEPGYGPHLDRDGDGVACEPYGGH